MLPVAKGLNSNDENDIQYLYRHESDFTNGGIMQRHEERALELVRRLLMKIRAPLRQSLMSNTSRISNYYGNIITIMHL